MVLCRESPLGIGQSALLVDLLAMQSNIVALKKYTKWLECTYVVVLLAALTQGPIFKLWLASAQSSITSIPMTYQLTFVIVQLPALLLLGRRMRWSWPQSAPVAIVGAFCLWMVLSTVWATSGRDTIVEATTLALTAATGVYIARSFTHIQQIVLVGLAMQPGVLFSYIAVKRNWEFAISIEGHWVGIYFNRNSLAPVAAVGLLAAASILYITVVRRRNHWWPATAFVLTDIALLDGFVLYRTHSSTSIGAIAVFVAVWGCWSIIRILHRRNLLTVAQLERFGYGIFIGGAALTMWVMLRSQEVLLRWLNQESFFNGRSEIWNYGFSGFLDRPFFGWGWMSAWKSSIFLKRDLWWTVEGVEFSHSSYIDVLLGGGVIGAVLFLVAFAWGGYFQIRHAVLSTAGQWTYAIMFFVLLSATQESFVVGNHFLWVLLVAAIAGPGRPEVLPEGVPVAEGSIALQATTT